DRDWAPILSQRPNQKIESKQPSQLSPQHAMAGLAASSALYKSYGSCAKICTSEPSSIPLDPSLYVTNCAFKRTYWFGSSILFSVSFCSSVRSHVYRIT